MLFSSTIIFMSFDLYRRSIVLLNVAILCSFYEVSVYCRFHSSVVWGFTVCPVSGLVCRFSLIVFRLLSFAPILKILFTVLFFFLMFSAVVFFPPLFYCFKQLLFPCFCRLLHWHLFVVVFSSSIVSFFTVVIVFYLHLLASTVSASTFVYFLLSFLSVIVSSFVVFLKCPVRFKFSVDLREIVIFRSMTVLFILSRRLLFAESFLYWVI